MAGAEEDDWAKVGENDQISEEEDDHKSSEWTVADTALAAGDGLEGATEALADGLLENVADLGSAAAQIGETVIEGAVEAISTIVGSILDS